jgi:hypothetical protein
MRHAHVAVMLDKYTSVSSNSIKNVTGYYAHMARGNLEWVDYLEKEGNILLSGIGKDQLRELRKESAVGKWDRIDQIARQGGVPEDVMAEMGGFFAQNASKIRQHFADVKNIQRATVHEEMRADWKTIDLTDTSKVISEADIKIGKWINFISTHKTLPKKCHLWVHGPTNCGKTEWWKAAQKRGLRVFLWNPNKANWQDDWNSKYDMIVMEEFNPELKESGLSIQMLNALMDANAKLSVKYQPAKEMEIRIPLYICSNQDPRTMFLSEPSELRNAFFERFWICQVAHNNRINLFMEHRPMTQFVMANFDTNERFLVVKERESGVERRIFADIKIEEGVSEDIAENADAMDIDEPTEKPTLHRQNAFYVPAEDEKGSKNFPINLDEDELEDKRPSKKPRKE